ncbi:LLM class F420-dependent oxidoreductase [soil metagenome]
MRLGLSLGHLTGDPVEGIAASTALALEADRLGYAVVWAAEAYGSDAATLLAYLAAHTERIDLGAAVFQVPGRSPALTAMTAATLDALSGGRFRLGLGVSGPQVSEGWHGVRFDAPLARTREYVDVVRMALRREPVRHAGEHYPLPLPGSAGKALRLSMRPVRPALPVYLAAVGPRNIELAGEIADGWLALFLSPEHAAEQLAHVRRGAQRAGRDLTGFEVAATAPLSVAADVETAADAVRGYAALYLGGMGSRERNFYNRLAVRMGYADAAAEVQTLYLAGRQRDAAAAVPLEFLDATSLIGPPARLVDRLRAFAAAGVTTLSVMPYGATLDERVEALRTVARAQEVAG